MCGLRPSCTPRTPFPLLHSGSGQSEGVVGQGAVCGHEWLSWGDAEGDPPGLSQPDHAVLDARAAVAPGHGLIQTARLAPGQGPSSALRPVLLTTLQAGRQPGPLLLALCWSLV